MKKWILALAAFFCLITAVSAQEVISAPDAPVDTLVTDSAETYPEFPGGEDAMLTFIFKNLTYPAMAIDHEISGKVVVEFTVNKEGHIINVRVLKRLNYGLDEEAMRVVKMMPRWKPGTKGGKPVNVRYSVPITFQLD